MSNPEDISRLQERLRSYRRSLATLLQQQADHGGRAFAPLPIVNAIDDNRKDIAHLKRVLRSWGQVVSDHPDDFTADNFPPDFAPGPAGPEPGTSAPLLARKGISPMVLVVVALLFLAAGGGMLFLQWKEGDEEQRNGKGPVVIDAPTETPEPFTATNTPEPSAATNMPLSLPTTMPTNTPMPPMATPGVAVLKTAQPKMPTNTPMPPMATPSNRILKGHTDNVDLAIGDGVHSVAFSPDSSCIVSGACGKTNYDGNCIQGEIILWNAQDGSLLRLLRGHNSEVRSVAFSPDGSRIVSAGGRYVEDMLSRGIIGTGEIILWNVQDGTLLHTLKDHTGPVNSVTFSPDGTRIVSGSEDNMVKVWDAQDGSLLHTLEGHTDIVNSVAFSTDGSHIVSGSDDKSVRVWNAQDGTLLRTLGYTGEIKSVASSPDGSRIASGACGKKGEFSYSYSYSYCTQGEIILWDAQDGILLYTLGGHTGDVEGVAFSPDGSRIVSGSEDNMVKVWDAQDGSLLHTLEGHTSFVTSVAFSPDGSRIVSGSWDNTVRVWDVRK